MQEKSKSNIKELIDCISYVCKTGSYAGFVYGSYVRFLNGGQFDYTVDIVLSSRFSTAEHVLNYCKTVLNIENITTNSTNSVTFVFQNLLVTLRFIETFNCGDVSKIDNCFLSIDAIFYSIQSGEIINPFNGIEDLASKTIRPIKKIDCYDALKLFGVFDNALLAESSLVDYGELTKYGSEDYQSIIESILTSRYPGSAIKLIFTLSGGDYWFFNRILDFLSLYNISISEDVSIGNIKNPKKLQLINVYSNFAKSKRYRYDSKEDKQKQLTSVLRMLFDVPTINLQPTYIDAVQVMGETKESDASSKVGTRTGSSAITVDTVVDADTSTETTPEVSSPVVELESGLIVSSSSGNVSDVPELIDSGGQPRSFVESFSPEDIIDLPSPTPAPELIISPPFSGSSPITAPPFGNVPGNIPPFSSPVIIDPTDTTDPLPIPELPPPNAPVDNLPPVLNPTTDPPSEPPIPLPDGDDDLPPVIIPIPQPCVYGNCDECHPEECFPQCCCCASIDAVSISNIQCHKKAVLSCNDDGTTPGPGRPPFSTNCPKCLPACETILGLGSHAGLDCDNLISTGTVEGWWNLPPAYGPCTCTCKQQGIDDCELTCVTCEGLYCRSDAVVASNNCNYNVYLQPSNECYSDQTYCVFCSEDFPRNWFVRIVGHSFVQNPLAGAFLCAVGEGVKVKAFHPADNGLRYEIVLQNVNKKTDPFLSNIDNNLCTWRFSNWDTPYTTLSSGPLETCPDIEGMEIPGITHTAGIIEVSENEIKLTIGGSCRSKPNPSEYPPFPLGHLVETFLVYKIPFSGDCEADYTFDPDAYDFDESYLKVDGVNRGVGVISHYGPFVISPRDLVSTSGFISSSDCLDYTPIRLKKSSPECDCPNDPVGLSCQNSLPQHCFDFPVKKCFPNQPDCDCTEPVTLNACGTVVVITPLASNLICCSEIGCDCPVAPTDGQTCCGPTCPGSDVCINGERLYNTLTEAQDAVWCECFVKATFVDSSTPNCSACCCPDLAVDPGNSHYPCDQLPPDSPFLNEDPPRCCQCATAHTQDCCACCLQFHDGVGGFYTKCKSESDLEVKQIWDLCSTGPGGGGGSGPSGPGGPPTWVPPNEEVQADKCIVGEPAGPFDEDRCNDAHAGCTSIKHPSTVVLNNGIGLVAYESINDNSVIKIQQFKTTVNNKIISNREFNFGRLEHFSKWTTTAKLYYYGSVPSHLLTNDGSVNPDNQDSWKDAICFQNGPLAKQIFPLSSPPTGEDEVGKYVLFFLPAETKLSFNFSSGDDVYNIRWFIYDFEDEGVIGQSHDSTTAGKNYLIDSRDVIDQFLLLPPHIYNGEQVPVAYPNITAATNYLNVLENSQFVYLVYQALENNKWNVYLRQIRLSEYNRNEQIESSLSTGNTSSIDSSSSVIYRIVCLNDECLASNDDKFLLKRNIVLEVLLSDGREILNQSLSGNWGSLCEGHVESDFPRNKVFIQFVQTAVCNECPDAENFNSIFPDWDVGQEFETIAAVSSKEDVFSVLTQNNASPIEIGAYSEPVTILDTSVYSSSIAIVWYQEFSSGSWRVINDATLTILNNFKGIDLSEPILLTENEQGHSTRPSVKLDYNNHVYVVYETTINGVQQIKLLGTTTPSNSLPIGVLNPRKIDDTLDYFVNYSDFLYQSTITTDGVNQLPDFVIDKNNVIHLTWQSNRDKQWEIYYGNSETSFSNTRITKYNSKSFSPKIDIDNLGRIFIVWHDNRFGNYEILLAYYNGSRTMPLYEQDQYLASIHNGYEHQIDQIELTLTNSSDSHKCYKNIAANFYTDRLLSDKKFTIEQNDWPIAFHINGLEEDTHEDTEDDIPLGEVADGYDYYYGIPTIDSTLSGSTIHLVKVTTSSPTSHHPVEVAFQADDNEALVISGPTSEWIQITANTTTIVDVPNTSGRFKVVSVRILSGYSTLVSVTIQSVSSNRLCLSPGEEKTAILDLTPEVRIDGAGESTSAMAISVGLSKNQTYFVTIEGEDADGATSIICQQKISTSCSSCQSRQESWDSSSCSLTVQIQNLESEVYFYNVKCSFYSDKERQVKVQEFTAEYNSDDLAFFTAFNQTPAQNVWTARGLHVNPGEYTELILYPSLSPSNGLLCGVLYFVEIEYCAVAISNTTDTNCTINQVFDITPWRCMCNSDRWEGEAPANIRDRITWKSSAFGFADTRITDTHYDNVNPVIKTRTNGDGVIIYSSNRKESADDNTDYKIFASVFSIVPDYRMYASGAQSVVSQFRQFIFQSDIPICENITGDDTCFDEQGVRSSPTLNGYNPSFSIDQFDKIFLACEQYLNNDLCKSLLINSQSIVKVHTGGADPQDLFNNETEEVPVILAGCNHTYITGQSFVQSNSTILSSIIRKFAVKNEFVKYHITKNNQSCAVVKQCNIELIIIGTPECVSVRIRNGSRSAWSNWIPFNHQISENSIETKWELSKGVGLKTVEMQIATYSGLSLTTSIIIAADYDRVRYDIDFYKSPTVVEDPEATMSTVWEPENKLSEFEFIPVASINPQVIDGVLSFPDKEYIFIEISPELKYIQMFKDITDTEKSSGLSGIEPLIDYIQQGAVDQFDVSTRWARNSAGVEVFRAYIIINRDNLGQFKDGLANIIVHFKNDCADIHSSISASEQFTSDQYNITTENASVGSASITDPLLGDRTNTGQLEYEIRLRPDEDPYFIFGDPNYRVKT